MGKAIYWNGEGVNFHTFLRWLPELGVGVFVSVNTSSPVALRDQIGVRALGLMVTAKTGRRAPAPPRAAPVVRVSARTLWRAAGRYASGTGVDVVTACGGGLRVTPAPNAPSAASPTMLPRADGWCAAVHPPADCPSAAKWIKPATVAGRHLLLIRLNGAPRTSGVSAVAEKIPSAYSQHG